MKISKIFIVGLLMSSLFLAGCNKSSGQNTSNDPSTEDETIYTVTESEYTSARNFLNSTNILTEGNFTISSDETIKFANGRVENINEYCHTIYDFKYDSLADEYSIDEYTNLSSWSVTHWATNELSLEDVLNILGLGFCFMPESFATLTYSEETHKYTGTHNTEYNIELCFEDGKLTTYTFEYDGNGKQTCTYVISDYGKTTINLPEVE